MAEDVVEYRSGDTRRQLYRYETAEGRCLVALDFEEVVAVTATGPGGGRVRRLYCCASTNGGGSSGIVQR
jgi:hypothetical protein